MRPILVQSAAVLGAIAILSVPGKASALDAFEIQVYGPDINRPGQFGAELHANYGVTGTSTPEYPGQVPPGGLAHFTLEPAFGVTEWLELGAYLQAMVGTDSGARYGGFKVRAKLVVPTPLTRPFFLGLNCEVGLVPSWVEQDGWANEFRPFLGYDDGYWLIDVNPIFGYALTGKEAFTPDFEPAMKVAWNTQQGFAVGAEYYMGLGPFARGFDPWREQHHLLFATFDLAPPVAAAESPEGGDPLELNLAVGRTLTDAPGPEWVVKGIIGKAF